MTRPARTAIKRPGAGVTIDRERLIRMRETRLMSRAQLARKMSEKKSDDDKFTITPDAIAKIENGYRRPKTSTLGRLCDALGCTPEELFPLAPAEPAVRVPCEHCGALFGHEAGCPDAT